MNLPPSASRMSEHELACWLVNAAQFRTYREARIALGRRRRVATEQKLSGATKNNYWWNDK